MNLLFVLGNSKALAPVASKLAGEGLQSQECNILYFKPSQLIRNASKVFIEDVNHPSVEMIKKEYEAIDVEVVLLTEEVEKSFSSKEVDSELKDELELTKQENDELVSKVADLEESNKNYQDDIADFETKLKEAARSAEEAKTARENAEKALKEYLDSVGNDKIVNEETDENKSENSSKGKNK